MPRTVTRLAALVVAGVLTMILSAPASAAVQVFFPRGEQMVAVPRDGATPQDALRALLRGPTAAERARGFRTYIPRGTGLRAVRVSGARVTVDLGAKLMQGLNAEGLNARLAQIVYTATAQRGITSARVLIQGGTVLGVFPGIDASVPLTREGLATPSAPPPAPTAPGTAAPDAGTTALQTRLAELGFLAPEAVDGRPGPRTTAGVIAFQKWARLGRDGVPGPATLAALASAARPAPVAAAGPGRRVELLLDRQIALAIQDDRVVRAFHVSSGAAATATPPGSYAVTRKELRSWSVPFQVWLPYASYFVGGIAFHEYPEVPVYPASHGCVRMTSFDAPWMFAFLSTGTPVRVYSTS
ncbi:L,D-transpeptidase family protein [Miltoncostaea oceani]|uniref:L,D-transpeptidase family protein n=1 Tax=Miltoncostaea oceani TaxID=2843216 RepID=UPI001C3C81E7|nr:L,D-transpeptidase family protein [Miltoncostaea oceani]